MAPVASLLAAFLAALAAGTTGALKVETPPETDDGMPPIHTLRPLVSTGGRLGLHAGVSCDSWRFAVETNTLRDWQTVPADCRAYVGNYMMGGRYRSDSRAVADEAIAYAERLRLSGHGKEVSTC